MLQTQVGIDFRLGNVEIRNVQPINEWMCGKGQYDT